MREIKLQFETLPPPHYYRSKSGLAAAEVADDFGLSPFLTQVLQYTVRVGRKSRDIADIVSDLEKIMQFAAMERDRLIAEAGGTIDRDTMTARFEDGTDTALDRSLVDREAEFDSLNVGDEVILSCLKEKYRVTGKTENAIYMRDNEKTIAVNREWYRNAWRKVTNA